MEPKIEPCGTLDMIFFHVLNLESTFDFCWRFDKLSWSNLSGDDSRLYTCSLAINKSLLRESKASINPLLMLQLLCAYHWLLSKIQTSLADNVVYYNVNGNPIETWKKYHQKMLKIGYK